MAENPTPSAVSVKEKIKKSRETEQECTTNLRQRQQELLEARKAAVDAVYAHQLVVKRLNEKLDNVAVDLTYVHVHYHPERETVMSNFIGSLLRQTREKPVNLSDEPSTWYLTTLLPSSVVLILTRERKERQRVVGGSWIVATSCC